MQKFRDTVAVVWSDVKRAIESDSDGDGEESIGRDEDDTNVKRTMESDDEVSIVEDEDDTNELMRAAESGDTEWIRMEVTSAYDIETQVTTQNWSGKNALMLAANAGHLDIVNLLFQVYFSIVMRQVEQRDMNGWNALMFASHNGHTQIVDLLLSRAELADLQLPAVNTDGDNAFIVAAREGHTDVIDNLFSHEKWLNSQLTTKNKLGMNAFMVAVEGHCEEVVMMLLENRQSVLTQVTETNRYGWNSLIIATSKDYSDITKMLLMLSKDAVEIQVTQRTKDGKNALMIAAENGRVDIVTQLANVDRRLFASQLANPRKRHENALLAATDSGHSRVVDVLVKSYYAHGLFVSLFIDSISKQHIRALKPDKEYKLPNELRLRQTFGAFGHELVSGTVSERELAVDYFGDVIQKAVETKLDASKVFTLFKHLISTESAYDGKKELVDKLIQTASTLILTEYHGSVYIKVHNYSVVSGRYETPNQHKQRMSTLLADSETKAKVERFLARHTPTDESLVAPIERLHMNE